MTTRVRAGLRIPYEQNTKLILIADERGISKNALVLEIISDYLYKPEKRKTSVGTNNNQF